MPANFGLDLSPANVFLGMSLAFILCLVIAKTYAWVSPVGAVPANLPKAMVLLGVAVSLIMAVIGNSLARAFGAIGALSLVRFRTAVKEPIDLAHIFMSIAVGMACGSGYFAIATGSAAILSLASILIARFPLFDAGRKISLVKIRFPLNILNLEEKILGIFKEKAYQVNVLAQESQESGKICELVLEVGIPVSQNMNELLSRLAEISSDIKASILLS